MNKSAIIADYAMLFKSFKWHLLLGVFLFSMVLSIVIVFPLILICINLMFLYVRFLYLFLMIIVLAISSVWPLSVWWSVKTLNLYEKIAPLNGWLYVKTLGIVLFTITLIIGTIIVLTVTPYFIT